MSCKSSAFLTSLLLATVTASLSAQSAAAASRLKHVPIGHHLYNIYSAYGRDRLAHPAALPYGPEYGFLSHVPANAIRTLARQNAKKETAGAALDPTHHQRGCHPARSDDTTL